MREREAWGAGQGGVGAARAWLTSGLWMISLVMKSLRLGKAFFASYAIRTARSTPQQ